ncbi:hypothetical protein [Streptomyces sp. 2A115]|uniref:hypothetical protein n=1 Tax=Streptomyces sp. 2A115 TaxID=3457439 RepID=UPI003FD54263
MPLLYESTSATARAPTRSTTVVSKAALYQKAGTAAAATKAVRLRRNPRDHQRAATPQPGIKIRRLAPRRPVRTFARDKPQL